MLLCYVFTSAVVTFFKIPGTALHQSWSLGTRDGCWPSVLVFKVAVITPLLLFVSVYEQGKHVFPIVLKVVRDALCTITVPPSRARAMETFIQNNMIEKTAAEIVAAGFCKWSASEGRFCECGNSMDAENHSQKVKTCLINDLKDQASNCWYHNICERNSGSHLFILQKEHCGVKGDVQFL